MCKRGNSFHGPYEINNLFYSIYEVYKVSKKLYPKVQSRKLKILQKFNAVIM